MKIVKQIKISPEVENAISTQLNKFWKNKTKKLLILIKESASKSALKDMEGVGGYCPRSDFIQISIDPDHPKFKADPVGAVSRSFAHELYHAMRFAMGASRPDGTMLDCIVDEGLADQFVFEATGRLPTWNKHLSSIEIKRLFKEFNKIFRKKVNDKNYGTWFARGSKKSNIPRWAGYSLGLMIVRFYLRKHKGSSAKKMLAITSEEILNGSNAFLAKNWTLKAKKVKVAK
jgi:Predicted Zn-dependent protease